LHHALIAAADPSNLMAARQMMAFTLGTHIVLASFGVAFPFMVMVVHLRGLRRGDAQAMTLARRWSKVMAVLFAVGAVTGTVLSFELGLLWPELMGRYGEVFGIPFAFEALFFFTEAIFIAIYLYGWKRMRPWPHFWTIVPIVLAGMGGTFSIVAANAWMNNPSGFTQLPDGTLTDISPAAAIFNPGIWHQVPHMYLAAFIVVGFTVASVYAVGMLRGRRDRYHRLGFLVPFTVAAIAMPLQFAVGDQAARSVASAQPTKFAAQELVWETGSDQPEIIGGIMDPETGEVRWGIAIPGVASLLTGFTTDTVIQGLTEVPPEDRPPVNVVHLAFDVMVGLGSALLALSAWFAVVWWRRRDLPATKWFLRAATVAGAAAIITMEAGWIVTEVGRQPWVVYGYLRTEDAVTTAGGIWWWFAVIAVVYAAVISTGVVVIRSMAARWRAGDDGTHSPGSTDDHIDKHGPAPYGPRQPMPAPEPSSGPVA
jgi:cytochrome d ubiquinol oxidase subunit I